MTVKLQREDAGLGLADQGKDQEPDGQRKLGGLHNRRLMTTGSALVALEPPAVDEAMLMPTATGKTEASGETDRFQGGLILCF